MNMHRPVPADRNSRGFTLIELLVVIAILGLLIAVLLPALARARYSAKVVACQSNLHQIGIGTAAYCADANTAYPLRKITPLWGEPYWIVDGTGADDRTNVRLYYASLMVFMCPLVERPYNIDTHSGTALGSPYEMWYGWEMQLGQPDTRMLRQDERPEWAGRKFNVLAADVERVVTGAYGFSKINAAHPDDRYLQTFFADDAGGTWSGWHNPAAPLRGTYDRNFLFDTGDVQRMRLAFDDPRTATVPYNKSLNVLLVSGRLPPMQ